MDYPLSSTDIKSILPTRLITYNDLNNFSSIDQLLINDMVIILVPMEYLNQGHWICLIKNLDGIEYFDPYGFFPEEAKKYTVPNIQNHNNLINKLMKNSPYQLSYNEIDFQAQDDNIATCGRWCILRCLMRYTGLYEFESIIKDLCKKYYLTPDEFVYIITEFLIGK